MKNIKPCLTVLSLFCLYLFTIVHFSNGFYINNGINPFPKYLRPNVFLNKKKIMSRNPFRRESFDHDNLIENPSSVHNESVDDNTKKVANFDVKGTRMAKEKFEIDEILRKSESIVMERSFSFKKEDITIKPELLKELITQKYRKLFQRHDKDCGSSEIQIIILTFKIYFLTEHMKKNKKDFACLRGLFKCVSKRRRLLVYLGQKNREMFDKITDMFKIKKPLLPGTAEYYSKDLKYIHFNNTKRFKNNAEKKKKEKLKGKKVQTDKILFGS
ncbi:30S ribosomal protein S15, putative [Plasmodium ovale]|uniref:30S ribosomal protein S15, putative n=1 Tax=Plasmodium ovale TaxID=36330 RepID=A0A1D3THH0_PLAOA|nr:30S ribosomal protein S15, putative [Plasmodium ovale]